MEVITSKALDWSKFAPMFHPSWHKGMQGIIESKEMWNIYQFLKDESRMGKRLCPRSGDVFAGFQVDLDKLEVVVMGMDVYPQWRNGKPVANGIAMDCSIYGKLSPTLEKLYKGFSEDLGEPDYEQPLSLKYLVDQNILLTNAALTCERDMSGKHLGIWKPFWELVFDKIFADKYLIFIFLGRDAQKYARLTVPFNHYVFKVEHPVAASYQHRDWITDGTFSKVNKLLREEKKQEILWLKK